MLTQEQVTARLETILVPGIKRSLADMNLIHRVNISENEIDITLTSSALSPEVQEWLKEQVASAVRDINEAKETKVDFIDGKPKDINSIGHIIAIMSGKGGVGKSLVAGLTAVALKRQGYEVGILDADITGPSIPRMFGITTLPTGNESGILPVLSRSGIEVMSMNLLLPKQDEAVIWRGPLIARAITQFWEEVLWGKLDYLIVDLPPGTGDASLTVMQTIPITGVIIVFTPQDLVEMIVRKAVNMTEKMEKPILGLVENMSYFFLPDIDKKIEIFGKSRSDRMAISTGAPLLAEIPIDPVLARICDEGNIERYNAEVVPRLGQSLFQVLSAKEGVNENKVSLPPGYGEDNDYSQTAREHIVHPRNLGGIAGADGYGKITGPCGDTMQLWIRVKENIITDIAFMTDGCANSIAAGSMATELTKAINIKKAMDVKPENILSALGGLPEDHCALLAVNTIKEAIRDYQNRC